MLKYLRIAVTALSLAACVLLIALWVRSYRTRDLLYFKSSATHLITVSSMSGRLLFINAPAVEFQGADRLIGHQTLKFGIYPTQRTIVGFGWVPTSGGPLYVVPQWFPIIVVLILAVSPWIKWRFSLRTLLIATTLVAVGMGMVIYLAR